MGFGWILTKIQKIKEFISHNYFTNSDNTSEQAADNCAQPLNNVKFDMNYAADMLNNSGEFHCHKFLVTEDQESWVVIKPRQMRDKEILVEIDVTINHDTNEVVFVMPMYGDGSEGLVGENVLAFYNLLTHYNSRLSGGFFTKHTYDKSYAPIFKFNFPLSLMNFEWFKNTLFRCIDIHIVFRPEFDKAIERLNLGFSKEAGIVDPIGNYALISKSTAIESYV